MIPTELRHDARAGRGLPADVAGLLPLGPVLALQLLRDRPAGLRLGRVQLGSGGSSLQVTDRQDAEWVLHWPRGAEPMAWSWPADPDLPSLQHLQHSVADFLAAHGWSAELLPGPLTVTRLGYKPLRRATFRLDSGSRRMILKLVCPADFPAAAAAARHAGELPVRAPRLIADCAAGGAVLLEFLPGTPLDRLLPADRPAPLAILPDMLCALHDSAAKLGPLPAWSVHQVGHKLDALAELIEPTCPALAEAGRSAAADIAGQLGADRPWDGDAERLLIHGDLSLRNLVYEPAGHLSLIDWDRACIGPPEADLSPLVGLLGAAAKGLVDDYQRASGRRLDRRRLSALVQANRLARALRRVATGRDGVTTALSRFAEAARPEQSLAHTAKAHGRLW